jgi:biopolymer transport protein TolR
MTPLRSTRRKTRPMSDINVVPYIDVMLVLLVIFMVTAPLIPSSTIELARAGGASSTPSAYLEVLMEKSGAMAVKRSDAKEPSKKNLNRKTITEAIRAARANDGLPVVITADKNIPYGEVAGLLGQLKDELKEGDVPVRVGLMVRPDQAKAEP